MFGSPPLTSVSPNVLAAWLRRVAGFSRDAKLYLIAGALMGIGNGASWVHLNLWYKALGLSEATIGTLVAVLMYVAGPLSFALLFWRKPGRVVAVQVG